MTKQKARSRIVFRGAGKVVLIVIIALVILAVIAYIVSHTHHATNVTENTTATTTSSLATTTPPAASTTPTTKTKNEGTSMNSTSGTTNKSQSSSQPTESKDEANDASSTLIVAADLSTCTPYKGTFVHPLTGDTLTRQIVGIVNGLCVYIEQMPNNGQMECKYNESERIAVAAYYKDTVYADSSSVSASMDSSTGDQTTTYTMDGRVTDNPLQDALDDGTCVITGYD